MTRSILLAVLVTLSLALTACHSEKRDSLPVPPPEGGYPTKGGGGLPQLIDKCSNIKDPALKDKLCPKNLPQQINK